MPTEIRKLKPGELCHLLNSTPLGEVITDVQLRRQRTQAGLRVGPGKTIDLLKYGSWLVGKRHLKNQNPTTTSLRDEYSNRYEAAIGTAMAVIPANAGRTGRQFVRAIAALLTEPTHVKAATKAGISESTLYRLIRQPDFQGALGRARRELMNATMSRAQAYSGAALDALVDVTCKGKRDSDRVRAATQLLDQSWRGLNHAEKIQDEPMMKGTETASSSQEIVQLLANQLRQVEKSSLPLAEKARLTVSLSDTLLRAREVEVKDQRAAKVRSVLAFRKAK